MKIFHEITKEQKNRIISRFGFSKTGLYIPDDLWGLLEKTGDNRFRLTIKTFDSSELIPWIRTFTGRIISVNSSNKNVMSRFYNDVCHMRNTIYKDGNYEDIS